MSYIIKYKPKEMYVEYIDLKHNRICLCEDGLESFQFSSYETAKHSLEMAYQNLDNYVVEEFEE